MFLPRLKHLALAALYVASSIIATSAPAQTIGGTMVTTPGTGTLVRGNIAVASGPKTITDSAKSFPLPNAALQNPQITVAGHAVQLGGSTLLNCVDLADSGSACPKSVGTTTGTVAAGDDSRITGALQTSNASAGSVTATGGSTAQTLEARFGQYPTLQDFGAKADGVDSITDFTVAVGTDPRAGCSASRTFTSADIGKTIAVGGADVSHKTLVSTIAAINSTHCVEMVDAATYSVPWSSVSQLTVSAPGTGWHVNDPVTIGGGTLAVGGSAATGIVKMTKVVSVALVNGGSTSNANGTCTATGTTGTPLAPNQLFQVSVTITGGTITAVTATPSRAGLYTGDPTSYSSEPITGCGLSGATVSIGMGAAYTFLTSHGQYSVLPTSPASATGSGSGLTLTLLTVGTRTKYGTDNSAAWLAAKTYLNTLYAAGVHGCVRVPFGLYLLKPDTTDSSELCVHGEGFLKSVFSLIPNTGGRVFSCPECWQAANLPYNGVTASVDAQKSGLEITDLAVVGDRDTTVDQDIISCADRCDNPRLRNVQIAFVKGKPLDFGHTKLTAFGWSREGSIQDLQIRQSGDGAANPCVDFDSNGAGDGSNQMSSFGIGVYSCFGTGVVIRNLGTNHLRTLRFSHLRVEGQEAGGDVIQGDNVQIGDASETGTITDLQFDDSISTDPPLGGCAVRLLGQGSLIPSTIKWNGYIYGGANLGDGLCVDQGSNSAFDILKSTALGYDVKVGANVTGFEINGHGQETSWMWSVDPTSYAGVRFPDGSIVGGVTSGVISKSKVDSAANQVAAFAGGGSTNATQLTATVNRITAVANNGDSVKLGASGAGVSQTAINISGTKYVTVWPTGSDLINGGSSVNVPPSSSVTFRSAVAGQWNANIPTPSSNTVSGDIVTYAGTLGQQQDSGLASTLVSGAAQKSNNLSDLSNAATARSNLGANDASNLTAGNVAAARGGAGTVNGALKGNGSGVVSQAACADLSNASASCSTDATNAGNISSGTLSTARGGTGVSGYNIPYILDQGATGWAVNSGTNSTEDFLTSIADPAGAMGNNGCLKISSVWDMTPSSNSKVLRIRLSTTNSVSGTAFLATSAGATSASYSEGHFIICNRNSASSQVAPNNGGAAGFVASGVGTGSINTAVQTYIVFTCTKALATETCQLDSYSVELLPHA